MSSQNYTVLARKYRPNNLDGLVGQDAMVRTLKNAMANNRLAHAFLLTGIRGVGKTSTARILARALNQIPAEQSIDGHIDIVEMDAASHTGVDDVREIIESARYKPVSAPYKIFIIDEVHMLSKNAFNALLKTLEEPPAHVKFIFATTEIRKVPVTILSRCQRFDLRRIDAQKIAEHLRSVANAEQIKVEDTALQLIAAASEGSMRDSLSLLDQAIAFAQGEVSRQQVQQMLGFADRSQIIALFELLVTAQALAAIQLYESICQTSSEPHVVLQNLAEITHAVTRTKLSADHLSIDFAQGEIAKLQELAQKLDMAALSIIWQKLSKSLAEIKSSANPKQAGEMALIRVAYGVELPEISPDPTRMRVPNTNTENLAPKTEASSQNPTNFGALAELFREKGEFLIYTALCNDVHLVNFKDCQLEIRLNANADRDLPHKITSNLQNWTGKRWVIVVSNAEGAATLATQTKNNNQTLLDSAIQTPEMQKVFEMFPQAKIINVKINNQNEQEKKESI